MYYVKVEMDSCETRFGAMLRKEDTGRKKMTMGSEEPNVGQPRHRRFDLLSQ
jgi:hypothetical protein